MTHTEMDTEVISESFQTLFINKLRTALAMLGIVIGIGSVIALISLGQASQQAIQSQIQSLGSNLLTVQPSGGNSGPVMGAAGSGESLTVDDAKAIKLSPEITAIKNVSPEYQSFSQITTVGANTNTRVIGVVEEYAPVHNIEIELGEFITNDDDSQMKKVAVLGPTTAETLFGSTTAALGQTIRIEGQTLTVIGTTVSKGGSGFMNADDIVYVPLSTAQKQLFGDNYLSSIALEAKSSDEMLLAQNQVGYFLLKRHGINDPADKDFSIFNQQDIINTVSATTGTFTTLLSGVAAISLLVGGIGIMNIMLVSVTERTREIGLRKALGAKKKTIITQFLVEAIILTFVGGIAGVGLGIIASYIFSLLMGAAFIVSPNAILLAFAVSAGIGVLFGWYPARRAANLQPIEALRYE